MQKVMAVRGGKVCEFCLPAPDEIVVPGVIWGRFDEFFTPAFWKARLWIDGDESPLLAFNIGRSLREEVAACLLGGFGMSAELGLAAFERLRNWGLLTGSASVHAIERALREPLSIAGRPMKYRYPSAKSRFLNAAMVRLDQEQAPTASPLSLRNWLLTFPGVGLKTASWITRNFLKSDEVAILDVHVVRAGLLMGLFTQSSRVPRDYLRMEERLVALARAMEVELSKFDSVLWCYMRRLNSLAIESLRRSDGFVSRAILA